MTCKRHCRRKSTTRWKRKLGSRFLSINEVKLPLAAYGKMTPIGYQKRQKHIVMMSRLVKADIEAIKDLLWSIFQKKTKPSDL